jgi:ABC-type transport system involved in multi-copper enzyme maturation permease subunit
VRLGRILVVAVNVFREVIRDRVLYLIGVFALLFVAAAALLPEVAAGTEDKILQDLGLAAIALLSLVIAVFVGTGLVNKEIEKRTVFVLIAKPISRVEFIVGKHLGLTVVLAVLVAAMMLIYLAVLSFYQVPYPLGSTLLAAVYLLLELSLITAVAILFGVFTSSLLATLLTFAVYLMGHFSQDLVELGNLSENPGIQRVTQALYLVLPDLSRLNLKNQAIYGSAALSAPLELLSHAAYGLLYTVLLLAIASLLFSRREF